MTKEQILKFCKEHNVRFVNFQFCDLLGTVKSVTTPVSKLKESLENNIWFDGSSIEGFARIYESDMYLKPDLDTFALVPWESNGDSAVARIICDVFLPDGNPFDGDPRQILKKQIKRAQKMGFDNYFVGPELEFFLFKTDEDGAPALITHDRASYFDYAMDKAGPIRQAMSEVVSQMGIDVESIHHEVAESQHEIAFKYSDAITQADAVITVKTALKAVARQWGLHATFMPKPIAGINGSGMHVHQSLFKNNKNAFYDEKNTKYKLSKTALQFIAGQLSNIHEIVAVTNPLINSYKRLVPGYEAPVYVAWGQTNRSALIRVPIFLKGQSQATRCELRCPDSSSNPYLAFATMLAIGLDGIEKKMTPPESIEENIYEFTDKKAQRMRVRTLPDSLPEALKKFEGSKIALDVFGEQTHAKYLQAKQAEADKYRLHVSDWEVDEYLGIY